MLDSVRVLALQCDVLMSAQRKQKKFLVWCQETLLTGILWQILESAHSQVAQVAVPLILHAVTLPGGADALWKCLDEDFHSEDWRVRFAAVEKVTVIFRFLTDKPVKKSTALRSVLSHAFCCLIACMDDITPHVSQRATLYLGTIHDGAIKTLIWSLEYQFDNVAIDRPAILKRLYQLFTCLMDRKVLTWQFFASRFEVIVNEIQNSDGNKKTDYSSVIQKMSQDPLQIVASANAFQRHRSGGGDSSAGGGGGVRSLSANLKYPYKRTISAPAGMGLSSKTTSASAGSERHSNNNPPTPCHRQQSVPLLRGKISKDSTSAAASAAASGHVLSKQGSNVATLVMSDHDAMEYVNVAAKTVDLDEVDKESIHLLVFLFMQASHAH